MNPIPYQSMAPPPPHQWHSAFPPNPPPSSNFWNQIIVQDRLKELHETLILADAMQKELEMLSKVKEAKGSVCNEETVDGLDEFSNFLEANRVDFEAQELISVEAANELMSKLRFLLEPFRVVTDEGTPWEEKSAVARLSEKINKSKRNKRWRRRKRQHIAEKLAKEREQFERLDQEADEWRAREIAKDIAQRKVEKMKEIAKQKAKEEKKRLEAELELALMVEKLQELRSIRIQKLKKQGKSIRHFLPEEDDKFLERVRAAVEEEERQAKAAADTEAAKDAIAAAEESRKVTQVVDLDSKAESSKDVSKESHEMKTHSETALGSDATTRKESGRPVYEGQSYGTYDYVANLPTEFYHYYHGSNTDMGTLIEFFSWHRRLVPKGLSSSVSIHTVANNYMHFGPRVQMLTEGHNTTIWQLGLVRRTWDAYIRPGGSRIPGHWVQAPPPADETWASYLVQRK
ncbi:hypothetical protein Cgig2_000497 [Carnegiea gigantea]|uniref:Programmed cell death protein 7 n=1 Tax=Carnegiea gigantea TaxID=171969 RepID=A0A9Q1JNN1_9CARY|nr:hypothetical protein Cgig2_000497 [Carnegiea gigantea]